MPEKNKSPYSYHIFMFPFQWNCYNGKKDKNRLSFDQRVNTEKISKLLEKNGWIVPVTQPDKKYEQYNENVYFYKHTRPALFCKQPSPESFDIVRIYDYQIAASSQDTPEDESTTFTIRLHKGEIGVEYKLYVERISLRLYPAGVGVFTFHLENRIYSDEQSILNINQYGRRISPQFKPVYQAKQTILADSILLKIPGDKTRVIATDFSTFSTFPDSISKVIMDLLGEGFKDSHNYNQGEYIHVSPVIDDRMFVLCWYGNNLLIKKIRKWKSLSKEYEYVNNDFWHKFVFMDTRYPNCQSKIMRPRITEDSTYDRWIDYGSLYGISRYSCVLLTGDYQNLKDNNAEFLLTHMKTMYFQIVLLSLVQRATILRFSNEISILSDMKYESAGIIEQIRLLHKEYIRFINKLYIREITAQEQGIEMYSMLRKAMETEDHAKDLEHEVGELHQYASLIEDKKNNKLLTRLTIIGLLFVIPSFITGFLGMNIFNSDTIPKISYLNLILPKYFVPMIIGYLITPIVGIGIYLIYKISGSIHKKIRK